VGGRGHRDLKLSVWLNKGMLCDEKSWDNGNSVWFLMKKGAIWKTQYEIQYNTEMDSILCWNQTG